jgi:hypothetical protein
MIILSTKIVSLSGRRGHIERYGALSPWRKVDMKLIQDYNFKVAGGENQFNPPLALIFKFK